MNILNLHLVSFPFITAVQHERGPRNSTIRKQMAMYLKESAAVTEAAAHPLIAGYPHHVPLLSPMIGAEPFTPILISASDTPVTGAAMTPPFPCYPTPKVSLILFGKKSIGVTRPDRPGREKDG